jgi:hypothetical protein
MDTTTKVLLGVGAAALVYLYFKSDERKGAKPALDAAPAPDAAPAGEAPPAGTKGMGRRIHRPIDYQAAAVILGANAAAERHQTISDRVRKVLHDDIFIRGGEPINVRGKNNFYLGESYSADSKRAWNDLVANEAAVLANRGEEFYPHKPSIYSSLSVAEFRRRFGREPSNVYRTKHSPHKRPSNLAD